MNGLRSSYFYAMCLLVSTAGKLSAAYQVQCQGGPIANVTINSVFGEPRSLEPTPMTRFHGGVDVNDCAPTNSVNAIESGTFAGPLSCSTTANSCVRIENGNHAFEYEHLIKDPIVIIGSTVSAGAEIGTVRSGERLHLQESVKIGQGWYRVNPLRQNALSHTTQPPEFTTPNSAFTLANEVVLAPEHVGGADGTQTSVTAFEYRSSKYFVRGNVEVLVSGRGGPSRKGLYIVGFDLTPPSATPVFGNNIVFNNTKDPPGAGFNVIYATRNTSGFTHFATNIKLDATWGMEAVDETWDTTQEPDRDYLLCARIRGFPLGSNRAGCFQVYVDNTDPTFTMTNAGGTIENGGATSTATITIEATDPGGIYSIKVEGGVSYSSTAYISGVDTSESVTFPTPGTFADDGSYTVTVRDLAGNDASKSFMVGHTAFLVENAA